MNPHAQTILTVTGESGAVLIGLPQVEPSVADLLAQSRQAHVDYRQALPTPTAAGDVVIARDAVQRAAQLRAQAEVDDPDHADPAWQSELGTPFSDSDALLSFYVDQITR